MTFVFHIHDAVSQAFAPLADLYQDGFPGEDLSSLVIALLAQPDGVTSLTAVDEAGALVGHGLFTECAVSGGLARAALLGPLVVDSSWRRRGVGGALIRAGAARMAEAGAARVCVLGDPAYYGRFGFEVETGIAPPYPLPEAWAEAWRGLALKDAAPIQGTLEPPTPWRDPALWAA